MNSRIGLHGRDEELRWLNAVLGTAQRGAGALVAIEGAPGTGRSRLVLRVLQGRGEEAIEDLLGVGAYMRASGQLNPAWMTWGTAAAPALVTAGRADEARAVVLDELERARRWGAPSPIARALRVLAGLEDGDRVARLEEALAIVAAYRKLDIAGRAELGDALVA